LRSDFFFPPRQILSGASRIFTACRFPPDNYSGCFFLTSTQRDNGTHGTGNPRIVFFPPAVLSLAKPPGIKDVLFCPFPPSFDFLQLTFTKPLSFACPIFPLSFCLFWARMSAFTLNQQELFFFLPHPSPGVSRGTCLIPFPFPPVFFLYLSLFFSSPSFLPIVDGNFWSSFAPLHTDL